MKKWLESVYTDGSKYFISNPLPKRGEIIKIYLRIYDDSPVKDIYFKPIINGTDLPFKMKKEYVKNGLVYYSIKIVVHENILKYQFFLVTKDKIYYYNQMGIVDYFLDETYDFKILVDYQQPEWVKKSVFYQIFPERFCNGDRNLNIKTNEYMFNKHPAIYVKEWNSIPKDYLETFCLDFYGGDLIGVRKKIPYLKKLGINAIYMNPIFCSATTHKYDCLDFFEIDYHFGGNKAFEELMEDLHKNNIKLVLDICINHTGTENRWFNKNGMFFDKSEGAYNNKNAKEREYYFFNEDNYYKSWQGVKFLPTLNYTSNSLRNIMYKEEDSVIKKWLKPPYNIDGWRFDAADVIGRNNEMQIHHELWPEIRKSIKEENPLAYILAEHWSDHAEFLNGNEWDSAMNYFGFARPVREFLGEMDLHRRRNSDLANMEIKMSAKNLTAKIKQHLCKLPFVIQQNQFNLFDSHDIPRLHNNCKVSFEHYRGAVIMLFTFIGTASIYYGDEVGIDGRINSHEGCRYPMPWNSHMENNKYYRLYSKLVHLKTSEEALQEGSFKIISDDDYVFSYARFTDNDLFVIIISMDNENRKVRVPLKAFGKSKISIVSKDLFGEEIRYKIYQDDMIIDVKANSSYLIKFN